jgi:hypothetical protein
MWGALMVCVGLLLHTCTGSSEDGFTPTALSLARLVASDFVGLGDILTEKGVVAVTDVPALADARLQLLRAVTECSGRSSSFKKSTMSDGGYSHMHQYTCHATHSFPPSYPIPPIPPHPSHPSQPTHVLPQAQYVGCWRQSALTLSTRR